MGQRTRMGRAKTRGVPISRAAYRTVAAHRQHTGVLRSFEEQTREADNAAGRARFAAKHAAEPWVTYERTEQSNYRGPKTVKPRRFSPGSGQSAFDPSDVMLAVLAFGARLRSYRR